MAGPLSTIVFPLVAEVVMIMAPRQSKQSKWLIGQVTASLTVRMHKRVCTHMLTYKHTIRPGHTHTNTHTDSSEAVALAESLVISAFNHHVQ